MSKSVTAMPLPLDDDIVRAEGVLETVSSLAATEAQPAPTLITEQEVILGTVATVPAPSTWWWRRATRVVVVGTRRVFAVSPEDAPPKRRHYPLPYDFLEDSRMAREMHRL